MLVLDLIHATGMCTRVGLQLVAWEDRTEAVIELSVSRTKRVASRAT
jgi:hypothetical protein